jgi:hypothetical protein
MVGLRNGGAGSSEVLVSYDRRSAGPDAILDSRWRRFIRDVDQLIFLTGSRSDAGAYFTDAGVIDDVESADGLVVRMSAPDIKTAGK